MESGKLRRALAYVLFLTALALLVYVVRSRYVKSRATRAPRGVAYWGAKAQSGDIRTQCVGITKLSEGGDAAAVPILIEKLKSKHIVVRSAAANALGRLGDPKSVEPLIAVLDDKIGMVQLSAMKSLAAIGDERALPRMRAFLEPDDAMGLEAARLIGRLNTPEAETTLIEALKVSDPLIRIGALEGLGLCGTSKSVEAIELLIASPFDGVDRKLLEAIFPEGVKPSPDILTGPARKALEKISKREKHREKKEEHGNAE
jgi:HEAT repeat protein